jgi:hypothetical protein
MTSAGFEPAIPASYRLQIHALDGAANGMDYVSKYSRIKSKTSPASGAGNVSELRLMLEVRKIREVQVCFCNPSGGVAGILLPT